MSAQPPILPYRTPEPPPTSTPLLADRNHGKQFGCAFSISLIVGGGLAALARRQADTETFLVAFGLFAFVLTVWLAAGIVLCLVKRLRAYGLGLLVAVPVAIMVFFVVICGK